MLEVTVVVEMEAVNFAVEVAVAVMDVESEGSGSVDV